MSESKLTMERRWGRRIVAVGGAVALGLTVTACGAAKGAGKEVARVAENPADRAAARRALGFGGQAAEDLGRGGSGLRLGFHAVESGGTLRMTNNKGASSYEADIEHSAAAMDDNEITEEEVERIKCIYKTIKQSPDGIIEFVSGTSYLQRQPDGVWVQRIVDNNSGGPLDVCDLVLSALPGATTDAPS